MPLLRLLPFIKDNEVNGKICDDLFAKGVRTEEDLMWKEELIDIAFSRNIPYKILLEWKEFVLNKYERPLQSARLVGEALSLVQHRIPLGCTVFDEIMCGGFRTGHITELFGDEGAGKTQLCHQLALQVAGMGKNVLYIDTEASFSGEKLMIIMRSRKASDPFIKELVSQRIFVSKIFEVCNFFDLMYDVLVDAQNKYSNLELIVLDSILSLLAPQLIRLDDRGEKREQGELLTSVIKCLTDLVTKRPNICIIVTNGDNQWFGKVWKNCCETSVKITCKIMSNAQVRELLIVKDSGLVKQSKRTCHLVIKNDGFKNFEKQKAALI